MKLLRPGAASAVALTTAAIITAVGGAAGPAAAIVGGQDTTRAYPGVAFVAIDFTGEGTAGCGGTLIAAPGSPAPRDGIGRSRWLLTAAHCVSWDTVAPTPLAVAPDAVTVHEGSIDRTEGHTATGSQIFLNPDWYWGVPTLAGTPVSDIALVELDQELRGPVMHIAATQSPVGHTNRLTGWGLTAWPAAPGASLPTTLQQKDVARLPATACAGGFIGAGEICEAPGACPGDSGSPALRVLHGQWQQVALGSRETVQGDTMCSSATVDTDTVYFAGWLREVITSSRHQPCAVLPTRATPTEQDHTLIRDLAASRTWLSQPRPPAAP